MTTSAEGWFSKTQAKNRINNKFPLPVYQKINGDEVIVSCIGDKPLLDDVVSVGTVVKWVRSATQKEIYEKLGSEEIEYSNVLDPGAPVRKLLFRR
jgi:hypothetical protein